MSFKDIQFVDVSQMGKPKQNCSTNNTLKRKCFQVTKIYDDTRERAILTPIKKIELKVTQKTINEEILDTLKMVLTSQDIIEKRLSAIECLISDNYETLNSKLDTIQLNQAVLSQNQENLAENLKKIEVNLADKGSVKAQTKLLHECKVGMKKLEESVCRMSGDIDDEEMDDIAKALPLQSVNEIVEVENKLKSTEYAQAMTAFFNKLKGASEDVSSVIRYIFTDEVLELYNWDGRWEKLPLNKLNLVGTILRDVFKNQGAFRFDKSMKKSIELSHHRAKQKKYVERKNKVNI